MQSRLNQYIAQNTGLSRRKADSMIESGQVNVNGRIANLGQKVSDNDEVTLEGRIVQPVAEKTLIILNKPIGYVCSRDGQGSKTVYDLLPAELNKLKTVGRLDKYSSGLLLMTDFGELAQKLTHPKYSKLKIYEVLLDKPLTPPSKKQIESLGVNLEDGPSKLKLGINSDDHRSVTVTMSEGRNRQIRRTFNALGYGVKSLHRTTFGPFKISGLRPGNYKKIETKDILEKI